MAFGSPLRGFTNRKTLHEILDRKPSTLTRAQFARGIKAVSYLSGEFRLRSGQTSSVYWDKYRFESDPVLLGAIIDELEKLLPQDFDKLAGLELGGIPLATGLPLRIGKPSLYVRKQPKTYGTCNLVEGGFHEGVTAVVIEDVATTAGQIRESTLEMRKIGLKVHHAICVIDRQQGASENLREIGSFLSSVFTLDELEQLAQDCG